VRRDRYKTFKRGRCDYLADIKLRRRHQKFAQGEEYLPRRTYVQSDDEVGAGLGLKDKKLALIASFRYQIFFPPTCQRLSAAPQLESPKDQQSGWSELPGKFCCTFQWREHFVGKLA
jgi:hypothetical protein